MKIAILGAAGVRTPLLVQALVQHQERLGLLDVALMDVDGARLELIGALTRGLETGGQAHFRVTRTTDPRAALEAADFVITTFRVGGWQGRIVDERVPLQYGVLGQETTGPGGFAMGMRTIPVLLGYLRLMGEVCPQAWLVNFANPSGMLAEAAIRVGGWRRTVGICDSPQEVQRAASALLHAPAGEISLDYFGLNHLGWVRQVLYRGRDYLPEFIQMIRAAGGFPGLPFEPDLLVTLGMIPNEYLYYYYYNTQAVANIRATTQTRGERIAALNEALFTELRQAGDSGHPQEMEAAYRDYLQQRHQSYMAGETGAQRPGRPDAVLGEAAAQATAAGGYAGVALAVIEALAGGPPQQMILNVPNQGAVAGMEADAVVEVPALVARDLIRPLAVPAPPGHCLGLMQQVKAYERLTIAAAGEGSYGKALLALALHPLVRDYPLARLILDEYRERHGGNFPELH